MLRVVRISLSLSNFNSLSFNSLFLQFSLNSGKKFAETNSLTRHLFTHSKDRPYKCRECPQSFSSGAELNRHSEMHQEKQFTCSTPDCNRKFQDQKSLQNHIRKIHEKGGELKCSICAIFWGNAEELLAHMDQQHSQNALHECSICGWMSSNEKSLKRHVKDRHMEAGKVEDQQVVCELCGQEFQNKSTCANHKKRKHENPGQFYCSTCQKTFSTAYALKIHSKVHEKPKEWFCLTCSKVFEVQDEYKKHMLSHRAESAGESVKETKYKDKPMNCTICGLNTRGKWWLDVHMRSHTNERPFKCDFQGCISSFGTKNNLKAHKKIHSGVSFNFQLLFPL